MVPQNNDGLQPKYLKDLGAVDPRDNPERLYADEVRELTDYGFGWRPRQASAEVG